jgi:putative membrane protein
MPFFFAYNFGLFLGIAAKVSPCLDAILGSARDDQSGVHAMKLISKIVAAIVVIVIFGFALENMQEAVLHFFFGYEIRGPLTLLLFGVFLFGAVLGVVAMTPSFFRHSRALSKHKKTIASMQKERDAQQQAHVQPPQPDSIVNR